MVEEKIGLLRRLEERLYFWLDRRWRERADVDQIECRKEWLELDIKLKLMEKQ